MNRLRSAFTLIEILVSVLILSVSIIAVFKIYNQNQKRIVYVTERNKHALEDSLFLSDEVLRHHKEKRTAYDLLQYELKPEKSESRDMLKTFTRQIYIPEPINVALEDGSAPSAQIEEVKLKGEFSSAYYRFKILSF